MTESIDQVIAGCVQSCSCPIRDDVPHVDPTCVIHGEPPVGILTTTHGVPPDMADRWKRETFPITEVH